MQRQPCQGGIATEVGVGSLIQPIRGLYVGSQIFDKEAALDIRPPGAGVRERSIVQIVKGLLNGGGGRGSGEGVG